MDDDPSLEEMTEIADSSAPLRARVDAFLEQLCRCTSHDAAWLSVSDHRLGAHALAGSWGLHRSVTGCLDQAGPATAMTTDVSDGLDPGVSISEIPDALADRTLWSDCLGPAGFRAGLGTTIRDASGHQTGFVGLVRRGRGSPTGSARYHLERMAPLVTRVLSPMHALLTAARMVPEARAGVVLELDGSTCALPGMDGHVLLTSGSPAVRAAGAALAVGQVSQSFLWPAPDSSGPGGHVRLTVLATSEVSRFVRGLLLLTPDPDTRMLTPRELEVLGLLASGRSNQQIARWLAVAPRTVATHVEHVMRKLDAPSRTLAAVRAERRGLYVPPSARADVVGRD